jgi:hypothetical protein
MSLNGNLKNLKIDFIFTIYLIMSCIVDCGGRSCKHRAAIRGEDKKGVIVSVCLDHWAKMMHTKHRSTHAQCSKRSCTRDAYIQYLDKLFWINICKYHMAAEIGLDLMTVPAHHPPEPMASKIGLDLMTVPAHHPPEPDTIMCKYCMKKVDPNSKKLNICSECLQVVNKKSCVHCGQ